MYKRQAWSSAATYTITYAAVNDAPTSSGGAPGTEPNEDATYTFTTTEAHWGYSDVESTAMHTVDITTLPSTGTLRYSSSDVTEGQDITAGNLGGLTYVPVGDANGAITFTFKVYDGAAWSSAATYTITYAAVNDAPTSAAATVSSTEDTLKTYAAGNFAFTDVDSGDSITRIKITVLESTGDLECQNKNGGSGGWEDCVADDYVAAGTDLRLTPASDSTADVTFSFMVHDGTTYSAAAYVLTTTHSAVNDAPTTAGDTATVTEDDTGYDGWTADSDWGYSDTEGTEMVKILIVTTVGTGTLAVDADSGNDCDSGEEVVAGTTTVNDEDLDDLEFCPAANNVAQQTFTFKVHDGNSYSGVGTMTITMTAQNDAPSAGATADQGVYEDVAYSFNTATSTDIDGDDMAITCLERNNAGDATSALPAWIGVTDNGDGTATIAGTAAQANVDASDDSDSTYNVICTTTDDGAGTLTDTDVFVITLTAINDAPYLSGDTGGGAVDAGSLLEGAALSITLTATDEEGTEVTFAEGTTCPDWVTVANNGGASTGSLSADASEITDARVGDHTCDITMSDGTSTTLDTYTITITGVNDEPTLSATGIGTGDFTEDGSDLSLFSSAAAADSDATVTQTYLKIIVTVTNIADTSEYLVIDGSDCLLGTAATCVANTATNSGAAVVTVADSTSTVTWTADAGGISEAAMETLINALAYTNTDQSPTDVADRVVTITTLQDSGGTDNSGDDSVTVALASTVNVIAVDDDPTITNSDNTGAVTENSGGNTGDTLVAADVDGDSLTWSCTGCTDAGATQTLEGTYGDWVLTEATGAWTWTIDDADSDTQALDPEDTPTDTLTAVVSDGGGTTASITVTVTVTGANDAPTSSAGTESGTEDNAYTYAVGDFAYTDVDGDDSALVSITITVVESSGTLEKSTDGSSYSDVAADDVILNANIQYLRLTPASNAVADITFSYKVSDSDTASANAYVMTTSFAAVNDAPTVANAQDDQAVNEDATLDYTFAADVFTDVECTACTYTSTQTDGSDLPSWLTFTAGTRNYGGTPLNANVGTLNVRTTCSDGAASVNDDFDIVISNTNDAPTAAANTVTVNEDATHTFAESEFGYADVDVGDALGQVRLQAATAGTLWVDTDGNGAVNGDEAAVADNDVVDDDDITKLKWSPAANANGASYGTFSFEVYDGTAYSASGYTMTLTVTAVNDAPTSSGGAPGT